MKKILRRLKVVFIDVYIYSMTDYKPFDTINHKYKIEKAIVSKGKTRYFISDANECIHESFLFSNIFLLKSIKKSGLVIGDCKTIKSHRGQSIYPFVINRIAKDVLKSNSQNEIFVIVNKNNVGSIKGIEKAGFNQIASIVAKRWLWFYLKREVVYYK